MKKSLVNFPRGMQRMFKKKTVNAVKQKVLTSSHTWPGFDVSPNQLQPLIISSDVSLRKPTCFLIHICIIDAEPVTQDYV